MLDRAVKVTINKQFAEPDTSLRDVDEVALVPVTASSSWRQRGKTLVPSGIAF